MMELVRRCSLASLLAAALLSAWQQLPEDPKDLKLPNGKSQMEEILKADHRQSLRDAATLVELAEALQKELEKNEHRVLSVSSIRKTEEIEKLAKKIRSRLRRY